MEADELEGQLENDQPTDVQLLSAREDVNRGKRRVMKTEKLLEVSKVMLRRFRGAIQR